MKHFPDTEVRTCAPARHALAVLLLLVPIAACSGLLDVEAPSRIDAASMEDPSVAPLLVAGAVSDFECALAEYIVGAGLVGDELADAQLASAMWPYDQRQWNPDTNGLYATASCDNGAIGIYTPLSTARWQADNALAHLDGWTDEEVPDRLGLIATAAAFSGYSHVLLGEGMCSVAFDLGPELFPDQVFEQAVVRFTRAIEAAQAVGDDQILNLARVGRARARLNLGQLVAAAEDALLVPAEFVFFATYSAAASRRENDIYTRNIQQGGVTIEDDFRNLEFGGEPDPRVHVEYAGVSRADNLTDLWVQDKYGAVDTPIPIASWDEAQLIIAEAEGGSTAEGIINMFHTRAGLPTFSGSDPQMIMDHVIQERSRELFLESHHLGDKIRYDLPFTPAAGTPYPPKAGGFYGDMDCFPLPDVERMNNPSIGGTGG